MLLDDTQRSFKPLRTVASWMLLVGILVSTSFVCADEVPEYNRDILPILAENCFACHGADSAARKADLRLDKREAAIEAGAIAIGNIEESELIARLVTEDVDLLMPPPETKKHLTDKEINLLKKWVNSGAEYQEHWSFIAPQKPEPPQVKNTQWTKNAIDQFVLATLENNELSPAPEAEPRTLFRRLHLDITGLPPKPEEVNAFVKDYEAGQDAALSDWIDKLMQTPRWGEHRARYWLDAARYADTHGLHFDNYREMWPYRDWVIRSFNSNQPFDQFTLEQVAGDLLPNPTTSQLVATGFQRCNITTNEGGTIKEENLANYAADRVQTLGWVYLGLTTNCAQCHDHKFDNFSTKDYYSLAAFFRNTTQQALDGNVADGRGPAIRVPSVADEKRWEELPGKIKTQEGLVATLRNNSQTEVNKWTANANVELISENIATDKLDLHAVLNNGTGNKFKNQTTGTENFSATGPVNWIPDGKLGAAPLLKKGSTIDLGQHGDFSKTQPFSFGAWVKTPKNEITSSIFARMDENNGFRGWDLWLSRNTLAFHLINKWPENALKVGTKKRVVTPDKWQHFFVTYDGSAKLSGVKIYIDGKPTELTIQKDTLKPDADVRTKTNLRLGRRSNGNFFEGGSIQDARLYSRELQEAEITNIAQLSPIKELLLTNSKPRTPTQQNLLSEYYLNTQDPEFQKASKHLSSLKAEHKAISDRSPFTHIQREKMDSSPMGFVLMRGEYDKPGDKVEAATPEGLHAFPQNAPKNRLGLAQWLLDSTNPLTSRVTVNRFWQEVFGQGLVTTPEDFGVMGAPPNHPELLDWLAVEFRENGWNVKKMFKLFLMSATYRQAAITTPEKLNKDRDNALLSRGPRFRMDAEMVRDYALASSGLLSEKMYGPGTKPYQPEGIWDIVGLPSGNTRDYQQDKGENLYRRTVYNFWKRMAPSPNMEAFNAPSREVCSVQRERTNTPLQALVTLNDPQFVEAARKLAESVITTEQGDENQKMQAIALKVLSRPLSSEERSIVMLSLQNLLNHYQSHPEDAKNLISVGDSKAASNIDAAQLAAWTMLSNQILNLDETLNK